MKTLNLILHLQVSKKPLIQNSTRNIWHEVHYLALVSSAQSMILLKVLDKVFINGINLTIRFHLQTFLHFLKRTEQAGISCHSSVCVWVLICGCQLFWAVAWGFLICLLQHKTMGVFLLFHHTSKIRSVHYQSS